MASPHLFALYTEMVLQSIDDMGDTKKGGIVIKKHRHADDTITITDRVRKSTTTTDGTLQWRKMRKGEYS